MGVYGWTGILAGAGVIFYAYIGFDAVSCAAQEVVKPSRDIPIGILGSLFVCTILYVLVSAALLAGLLPIDVLSSMVSIGTLLAFTIVCISVVILRKTKPELERAFRTPWVPFIPSAGAIICFGQMLFLPLATWMRLVVWLAIGMAIYFGYGYRHSHLNRRR